MFETIGQYSALIASIWLVIGIVIASKFYPGYSHVRQFCSELGAAGSPTEKLSPRLNNYPLGVLFCLFGYYVIQLDGASWLIQLTGYLVIVHGVGTWLAGYFPMDADPYTEQPSLSCNIHSWAGLFMLVSLLIAPLLIAASDDVSLAFRAFSLLSVLASVYYLVVMAKAFKKKTRVGFYQRVSYGIQLVWLSTFSLVISSS